MEEGAYLLAGARRLAFDGWICAFLRIAWNAVVCGFNLSCHISVCMVEDQHKVRLCNGTGRRVH